jgi:hypothetical protein
MFRDLDALRHAGVPLEFDADRDRYSIPNAYFLPPVNFTAAEALSLMALAIEMGRGDRFPFYEPAQSAMMKLEGSLPPGLREQLRDMSRAIQIRPTPISAIDDKRRYYQQLVDARAHHRVVRIEYDSLTEWERITTKLRVYQLLFCRHSWYAIGRSSLHSEVRTYPNHLPWSDTLRTPGISFRDQGPLKMSSRGSSRLWPRTSPKSCGIKRSDSNSRRMIRCCSMPALPGSMKPSGGSWAMGTRRK